MYLLTLWFPFSPGTCLQNSAMQLTHDFLFSHWPILVLVAVLSRLKWPSLNKWRVNNVGSVGRAEVAAHLVKKAGLSVHLCKCNSKVKFIPEGRGCLFVISIFTFYEGEVMTWQSECYSSVITGWRSWIYSNLTDHNLLSTVPRLRVLNSSFCSPLPHPCIFLSLPPSPSFLYQLVLHKS